MSNEFKQVDLSLRRRGLAKPIAALKIEPDELSQRFGITFEDHSDDLGELKAALIETRDGRQFGFLRHTHCPSPGTQVLIDESDPDPRERLIHFMQLLGLNRLDISSTPPDIPI